MTESRVRQAARAEGQAEGLVEGVRILAHVTPPDVAQSTLMLLAGYRYAVEELEPVFGRERMIQSSVWQAALAEGKAEGLLEGLRLACRVQLRRHHPNLLARAGPLIEGCSDPERLQVWVVEACELEDAAFARLLGLG